MFVCDWQVCSYFSIQIVNRIYNKIWICVLIEFLGHDVHRLPRFLVTLKLTFFVSIICSSLNDIFKHFCLS